MARSNQSCRNRVIQVFRQAMARAGGGKPGRSPAPIGQKHAGCPIIHPIVRCTPGSRLQWRDASSISNPKKNWGSKMSSLKWSNLPCVLLLLALMLPHRARAEADTVRIAQPYGLVYLPSYVVVDRHMIEDRAAAAGLGPIKVTLPRLASGPAGSDMILAGDADLAMGGFGPALT